MMKIKPAPSRKRKPKKKQADMLRNVGRGQDSQLVHMAPSEVSAMNDMSMMAGRGPLTRNPETGLPEAFKLWDILPTIASTIVGITTGNPLLAAATAGVGDFAVHRNPLHALGSAGLSYLGGSLTDKIGGLGAAQAATAAPAVADTMDPSGLAQALGGAQPPNIDAPSGIGKLFAADTGNIGGRLNNFATGLGSPELGSTVGGFLKSNLPLIAISAGAASTPTGKAKSPFSSSKMGRNQADPPSRRRLYPDPDIEGRENVYFSAKGGPVPSGNLPALPGRAIRGPGGGMDDMVPAKIDGVQDALLSSGEYVIPADVVSSMGDGSTDEGVNKLNDLVSSIRRHKYGRDRQPPKL